MDSLQEWHRYVDEQSRPVRRGGEPERAPDASWRPWQENREGRNGVPPRGSSGPPVPGPEQSQSLQGAEIPDLGPLLGSYPATAHLANRAMEDPTLHDELPPIGTYDAPILRAPEFAIEPCTLPAAELAELLARPLDPGTYDAPEPPVDAAMTRLTRQAALLRRLSGETELSRTLSTRHELVQRLADPILTLEETALLLDVCTATVRRYTNRGVLRHFRTEGNQRRFRLSDVLEFLEQRRQGQQGEEGDVAGRGEGADAAPE